MIDYSSKCKRYYSRWWIEGTDGINALDQYWGKPGNNWAVPPPRLISLTLEKMKIDSAEGTLIVPEWPSAPFYPLLLKNGMYDSFVIDFRILPRQNVVKTGYGNNGLFGNHKLAFNMIALRIKF